MLKDTAYHYLADLIYKGGLFLNADLCGIPFVFRTLNEKDYSAVRLRSGLTEDPRYTIKFNLNYLVQGLYMVDGDEINHKEQFKAIYKFFESVPNIFYSKLIKELFSLRDVVAEVGDFIEGFCYTNQSRNMWESLSLIGIPEAGTRGLNSFQEYWIRLNKRLDDEEAHEKKFSIGLLISSAMNPKGAKHVRAQHDASSQTTREKRKTIAKNGTLPKSTWTEQGWAAPVDTAEDLIAELNRQMEGLKDKHDNLIDAYMQSLQDDSDKQAEEEKRKIEEALKKHEGEPDITGSQRELTPAEAEELMNKFSKKTNNLVMVQSDEVATPEQSDKFLKKIGNRVLTPKG